MKSIRTWGGTPLVLRALVSAVVLCGLTAVALAQGTDDALWIGTERGGLVRWQDHHFTSWQAAGTISSLAPADNEIRALYPSPHDGVWLGTRNGLDLFRAGQFTHYTTADGLQANNIRAVLRRSSGDSRKVMLIGDIEVDMERRVVSRGAQEIKLAPAEYNMLAFFLHHPDRPLTRDMILNSVWGYSCTSNTRTVDAHVLKLRQKLESDPNVPRHILTVHGVGYRFLP